MLAGKAMLSDIGSGASVTPGDPRRGRRLVSHLHERSRSQGPEPCLREMGRKVFGRLSAGRLLPVDSGFSRSRKQSPAGQVDPGVHTVSLVLKQAQITRCRAVGSLNPSTGGVGRAFI